MVQQKVVLEKPRIEPAAPGLQGIALIHYTMAASVVNGRKMVNIYLLCSCECSD